MAYEYFISYRRNSGGISQAKEMFKILKTSSIKGDVFWDLESIGEGTYPPQIENAIKKTKHFILLINAAFFKEKQNPDDWFFKEIRSALSSPGIDHITPIFFDGVSSDLFNDVRMPEDLKALSKCQKLVYCKDNATHFDLFVRDHFELVKKQGEFEGFGDLLRAVFNIGGNVYITENKGVVNIGNIVYNVPCRNLSPMPMPDDKDREELTDKLKRKELTKKLYDAICNKPYVNLWGIGGFGKTSLVRMCVNESTYKDSFGSVVYIPVEHNIERDFISEIKNDDIFAFLTEREKLKDDVLKDFNTLMSGLHYRKFIPEKINLLIFDINDTPDDDKGKTLFVEKIKGNNSKLPVDWKVLFISHSKCEGLFDCPMPDNDSDFAISLLESKCEYKIDNQKKEYIVETLFYNALLIDVVAGLITNDVELDDVLKKVHEASVTNLTGHKNEKDVKRYLNALVCLDKMDYNKKILSIMFMLWPSKLIPIDVVHTLLHGYKFQCMFGKLEVCHERDIYQKISTVNKEVAVAFSNSLTGLVKSNLLVYDEESNSYRMHTLIADVLRGQYYNIMHKGLKHFLFNFLRSYDHDNYVRVSREVLRKFSNKYVPYNYKETYLECIAKSISWIKNNDDVCGKMNEIQEILSNDFIVRYTREQDFKDRIKNELIKKEVNTDNLVQLYINFGDFYGSRLFEVDGTRFWGYNDASSAFDQYRKAIDVYEKHPDVIEDYSKIISLYLKCADFSEVVELDYYKKAVWVYGNNKYKSKLGRFYSELMSVLSSENFAALDGNDDIKADFYYRIGRFCEKYYWQIDRDLTILFNAKKFFKAADDIWSSPSFPQETEGELKGFVKTSYGLYDPRLHYKLVKVEKGSFDMGISDEEFDALDAKYKKRFERSKPQHNVAVEEDFYIGMYPVTQGQWELMRDDFRLSKFSIMQRDGELNSIEFNKKNVKLDKVTVGGVGDDYPMNYFNWEDANNFADCMNKLGEENNLYLKYYLPTEIQWEYAARGGKMNEQFPYSGGVSVKDVAVCEKEFKIYKEKQAEGEGPDCVGTKMPNSLGIYDMSGNVLEWCLDYFKEDWYQTNEGCVNEDNPDYIDYKASFIVSQFYIDGDQTAPMASGASRVLRGGSWNYDAVICRVSYRSYYAPNNRNFSTGFRLLLSSPKKEK